MMLKTGDSSIVTTLTHVIEERETEIYNLKSENIRMQSEL